MNDGVELITNNQHMFYMSNNSLYKEWKDDTCICINNS